jgi:ATP-binding protein involved in chromosome partitioning
MQVTEKEIRSMLESYIDPNIGLSFASTRTKVTIKLQGHNIHLSLQLLYPLDNIAITVLKKALIKALQNSIGDAYDFRLDVEIKIIAHKVQPGQHAISSIKNVIAIASGKGGVGKSTISANLALALKAQGATVGILDADIYGPSQPQIMGSYENPDSADKKSIEPLTLHGIQMMSIGNLVAIDSAVIWRGPMVSGALMQLITDTKWRDLDYLIVDLPPGTGDIQLTLAKKIPVAGAVVVTTPQDLSMIDARRAVAMFQKVNIPVLGIIENMSVHTCSKCGHEEAIFGKSAGDELATEMSLRLLGRMPLSMQIRQDADEGIPTVVRDAKSPVAKKYRDMALKMAAILACRPKNINAKLPGVVVESR